MTTSSFADIWPTLSPANRRELARHAGLLPTHLDAIAQHPTTSRSTAGHVKKTIARQLNQPVRDLFPDDDHDDDDNRRPRRPAPGIDHPYQVGGKRSAATIGRR